METREYHTIDKSAWGAGPWQSEPDKKQWQDTATELPCLIVRGPAGSLCGYVGVHRGHAAFEKEYNAVDVEVHGGLTFANQCDPAETEDHGICHVPGHGEDENIWWFGFDCAHGFDICPGREARNSIFGLPSIGWPGGSEYRTVAYVENQCRELAKQLAAIS